MIKLYSLNPLVPRYEPRHKRIDLVTASLVGDGINAGVNLIGGLFGVKSAAKDRQQQWDIAQLNYKSQQETNQLNMDIANAANANAMRMQTENNQFNAQQAELARQWSGAPNQVRLAQMAGLNPFASSQSQLGAGSGNMASAAPAGASLSAPQLQAPQYDMVQSKYSRMAEIVQGISGAIGNLASARKQDAETKKVKTMLSEELRGLLLENDAQDLELSLNKMFSWSERNVGLQNLMQDYAESFQRIETLASQARKNDADANRTSNLQMWDDLLGAQDELIKRAQYHLTSGQVQKLETELEFQRKFIQRQLNLMDSEIANNRASAREHDAGAADKKSHVGVNITQQDVNLSQANLNDENAFNAHEEGKWIPARNQQNINESEAREQKTLVDASRSTTPAGIASTTPAKKNANLTYKSKKRYTPGSGRTKKNYKR